MDSEQIELLKLAADARKLEIDNLWKRSLFFWGFITATAYAYWEVYKLHDKLKDLHIPLIVLGVFGFLCSECWILINVGSKFWHTAWEKQIEKLDPQPRVFFRDVPNKYNCLWEVRFSPSKVIILLSLITTVGWFVLVIWNFRKFGCSGFWSILIAVVGIAFAVLLPWLSTGHEKPRASSV